MRKKQNCAILIPVDKRDKKEKKKLSLPVIFGITFSAVLLLGLCGLLLVTHFRNVENAAKKEIAMLPVAETVPDPTPTPLPEENVPEEELNNKSYDEILQDPEYMAANYIFTTECASEDAVTVGFTGDILFDDEYSVMASLKQRGGDLSTAISRETLDVMNAMDIMVVNNEFPYTERGTKAPKKIFTFRADRDTVRYLQDMGADVAVLANNHVCDFGLEGLYDTLDTIEEAGIVPIGAGRNLTEATRPAYYIVNHMKIAILAATQMERMTIPDTPGATEESGGTFRCWTGDLIYDKIREAKENADFVIVCVHWGTEKESQPDTYQLSQAPLLAEAGADLIIGDHPHVLQGITYFGDVPCVYSLGNFWFNSSTLDTGIYKATIDRNGLKSLRFIPAIQQGCTTKLVYGDEGERIIGSLRRLSPGVTIDEDGFIMKNN